MKQAPSEGLPQHRDAIDSSSPEGKESPTIRYRKLPAEALPATRQSPQPSHSPSAESPRSIIGNALEALADVAPTLKGEAELRVLIELIRREMRTGHEIALSSRELASACKISRTSAQAAIDKLAQRHLITTRQGTPTSPATHHPTSREPSRPSAKPRTASRPITKSAVGKPAAADEMWGGAGRGGPPMILPPDYARRNSKRAETTSSRGRRPNTPTIARRSTEGRNPEPEFRPSPDGRAPRVMPVSQWG